MDHKDFEDMLDNIRSIRSGGDLSNDKIDQIETLEVKLRFLGTFIKYNYVLSPDSLFKITKKAELIVEMIQSVFGGIPDESKTNLNVERLISQLLEFIEGNTSLWYRYELNDSYISKYMDCLDKNLNDVLLYLELVRSRRSLANEDTLELNQFSKQVKIIQKKMRFLKYLYVTEVKGYVDDEKLEGLETRFQFMADNVGQFCIAIYVYEDGDEDKDEDEDEDDLLYNPPYLLSLIVLVELEMKKIFHGELMTSKFIQARTFKDKILPKGFSHHLHSLLVNLRNKKLENFPNIVAAQNIDVAIEFLSFFLVDVSNRVFNGKKLNEVLEKVEAIAGDILYVTQKLLPRSINKDDTSKVNVCSIQILEKTKDLKAQVKTYYKSLKFTPSQFPTVGGLGFLDYLSRKFNEMLKSESVLDFMMKPHIGILDQEMSSLASILAILEKEFSSLSSIFREVHHERETVKDLQRRTINWAYEAEVAIDSILVRYNVLWHYFLSLPTILKEIKHIRAKVTEMWTEQALKPCYVVEPSKRLAIQHSNHVNDDEMVGFESEEEEIIQYLIRGTNELDVISIVGMGGKGKTTISRKVYNNDMIASHFDSLAWCCISQTYNRTELLKELYEQVCSSKDNVHEDDEYADKLRKRLIGRRYLIVLDDMWDVKAWEDLMLSFPNDENRSRIIVTTRLKKVGTQIMQHTKPYFLPFLPLEESCALLRKRVFQNECPPPELYDVSLEVAKRCKGLPLVIILVAGIIKRKKMEASWWHEVKYSLLSYLGDSEEYSLSTMQLSYDFLPDHLRPCLLYMGMFPEDSRIPVSKLISLWIAEGFVQNIESGRLEEAAEGYLMDLISSNVVMASSCRYNGKVKYCQVHDIVLLFCLERSREEKFMLTVKGHRSQFQPSDWKENRLIFSFSWEHSKFAFLESKTGKSFHQRLRSLIITNDSHWNPCPQISKLGLLKVLDLCSNKVDHFSSATLHQLIHLKYLAVSIGHFDFHPESHLRHLETFVVKGSNRVLMPSIFWKMEKLRHIDCYASFDLENNQQRIFDESSVLKNLRTLKKVEFPIDDPDCMDVLLTRCPNLQELEISMFSDEWHSAEIGSMCSDEWHSAEICTSCPNFESLTQLQSLDLCFRGSNIIVSELHLPSNLKKLVLYGPHIVSVASLIAGLPSLEYLQLKDWRCESKEWCLGDITFDKLKFLKLVELGISRWDASEASFPQLKTLVIKRCYYLEEIPLSFEDIPTLKQVVLITCRISLGVSAVKIKEEIIEFEGCDRLDIIIEGDEYSSFQQH